MFEVWTEKYRPKRFSEIIDQEEIVKTVEAMVRSGNLPHLLFAGPPGTGKTTLALVIAHELYGENWRDNVLELNASDDRGIDVIRHKVKEFARTKPIGGHSFKLIILDEADALTQDAQQALRRIMENFSSTTRFILICNYSSKIIDPIQSRCAIFRFKPLPKEGIIKRMKEICENEGLKYTDEALEALYEISEGDMRRAINLLQACAAVSKEITPEVVYKVAGYAKPEEMEKVLDLALSGKYLEARSLLADLMLRYGLSGTDVVKQIQRRVINLNVSDRKKVEIMEKVGEVEYRISAGADPFIQLDYLLASIALIGKE